jgi:putative NADPH-quinone reductase
MSHIIVVVGHARKGTLCEALGEAYRRGAVARGHTVDLFVTSRMSFDPILHGGFDEVQPLEPDLEAAHRALIGADHIVLIFPLWLGTLPAIFKGFLERILQPDLVAPARAGAFVPVLKGKSARIIVTMGMPGLVYRWYYGAHTLKVLQRSILEFVGVWPIRSTVYGRVNEVGAEGRKRWIQDVEQMGRTAS